MRVLLDTQALFCWYGEPSRLSKRASSIIEDGSNEILVSAATAWELAIKTAGGKLNALSLVTRFSEFLMEEGFVDLTIASSHAIRAGLLPAHHRDPFDRMLIAQAQAENLTVVSNDIVFDHYGVRRVW
jgi:PIN domain nuclease of toxin-antitoxin system